MKMEQMSQEWVQRLAPTNIRFSQLGDMTQVWAWEVERAQFRARWDSMMDGVHRVVAPGYSTLFLTEGDINAYQDTARAAFRRRTEVA